MSALTWDHFRAMRELSPLPNPMQLRQWARAEAFYRDLREMANRHTPPIMLRPGPRFVQLPLTIKDFTAGGPVSESMIRIIKDRTEQVRRDQAVQFDFAEKSEMTDWLPGTVPPARPGVYELKGWKPGRVRSFARFNGRHWLLMFHSDYCGSVEAAIRKAGEATCVGKGMKARVEEAFEWRGFTTSQEPQ